MKSVGVDAKREQDAQGGDIEQPRRKQHFFTETPQEAEGSHEGIEAVHLNAHEGEAAHLINAPVHLNAPLPPPPPSKSQMDEDALWGDLN